MGSTFFLLNFSCILALISRVVDAQTLIARSGKLVTVFLSRQVFLQSSPTSADHSASDLVQIECNSNNIIVTLNSRNFNGMIYPKGLSKNSSCMVEYSQVDSVTYILPLRSCNTMSADVVSVTPTRRFVSRLTHDFMNRFPSLFTLYPYKGIQSNFTFVWRYSAWIFYVVLSSSWPDYKKTVMLWWLCSSCHSLKRLSWTNYMLCTIDWLRQHCVILFSFWMCASLLWLLFHRLIILSSTNNTTQLSISNKGWRNRVLQYCCSSAAQETGYKPRKRIPYQVSIPNSGQDHLKQLQHF